MSARGKPPPLLRFLVVHLFPFCDAALSRLPFAFLTIAIASSSSILLASAVLCAYQMARAISQASIAGATQPEARPDEPLKSLAGEVRRRKSLAGEISAGVIRNMMGGWGGDGPESPQRTSESDIVMF